jgi:hypothetical protein
MKYNIFFAGMITSYLMVYITLIINGTVNYSNSSPYFVGFYIAFMILMIAMNLWADRDKQQLNNSLTAGGER